MPRAVLLLPGVGAQGGRVEDLGPAFAPGPAAGLVTASRFDRAGARDGGWRPGASGRRRGPPTARRRMGHGRPLSASAAGLPRGAAGIIAAVMPPPASGGTSPRSRSSRSWSRRSLWWRRSAGAGEGERAKGADSKLSQAERRRRRARRGPHAANDLHGAPGDTIEQIAERTRVAKEQIIRLNPSLDPQALQPGQRIKLR